MLVDPTVPLVSAWNTWSDRPGDMVFLPLGVRVTPILYSTRARKAAAIAAGKDTRFGRHAIDGSLAEFEATLGGSRIAFAYAKPSPFAIVGGWHPDALDEWGLRFWVTLCLSAESGEEAEYLPADGTALVRVGQRFVALTCRDEPVQVTGHDSVDAAIGDFETNGYFHLASRSTRAKVIALRFNLEMMPEGRFAAAVADDRRLAVDAAKAVLAAPNPDPLLPRQTGRFAGCLDAVRDVVSWNTVWDEVNRRRYTAVSRIWNLGRFAVWYNDQTYAALITGLFDTGLGAANMAAAMASATPQGNIACLLTSNDAWVDRTQAPNGAFMAWTMFLRSRDRAMLELAYEPLARNQRWWRAHRDPDGRGLVSCGSSDVGAALYKGTHFGARNETGMDNSATHDEAAWEPATRTLSTLDVGLNASLALDAEMLALMARELGRDDDSAEFGTLAAASREAIRTELWDESRGLFANRHRAGGFVESVSPTSFYPLICGAATEAQAERLVRHLDNPRTFGGRYLLPNATREDPAYGDNVYWRGRIWPNVNYFVWQGLRRAGFHAEASALTEKSVALFEQSWTERRIAAENYNAETGEPMDQPDTDPFYSWGAMLPLLGVAEVMHVDPWSGWEIVNTGEAAGLGPIESPIGTVTLAVEDGTLTLWKGAKTVFSTDLVGRLSHVVVESGLISMRLHAGSSTLATLWLGEASLPRVATVRLQGREIASRTEGGRTAVDLSGAAEGARLDIHLSPTS